MNTFRSTSAVVAMVGAALVGTAVGLASPAVADAVSGDYTATMIDPGASGKAAGSTTVWTLSPCGADCLHVGTSGPGFDVYRQGDVWTGSKGPVTHTLDDNTLLLTFSYPDGTPPVVIGLVKNG